MSVKVYPLTDHERDQHRCAYCDKRLSPNAYGGNSVTFYNHPRKTGDTTPGAEEQLAAFSTNRRVILIRRKWHDIKDSNFEPTSKREVYRIDVNFYPDDDHYWGYDGLFCSSIHAQHFAHACYRGGFRMKQKTIAA